MEIKLGNKNSKNIVILLDESFDASTNMFEDFTELSFLLEKYKFDYSTPLHFMEYKGYDNVWILGIKGSVDKPIKLESYHKAGSAIFNVLNGLKLTDVTISFCIKDKSKVYNIIEAFLLQNYQFTKYKKLQYIQSIQGVILAENVYINDQEFSEENLIAINNKAAAVHKVRDLINTPAIDLYPKAMVDEVTNWFGNELGNKNFKLTVIQGDDIEKLPLLYSVGKASSNPPHVVIMEWMPLGDNYPNITLIGKGLTYDSGGLSLKPSDSMKTMHTDMSGAATVAGVMKLLVSNNIQKNIVGIIGLAENMVSGNSIKPGDIVRSFTGKSVEIDNTDAEGRLVLADLIEYAKKTYSPHTIITIATLTGGVVAALGRFKAGLFANCPVLAKDLLQSGESTCEYLWELPLGREYRKMLKSNFADIANVPTRSGGASSVVAAEFLNFFISNANNIDEDIDIVNDSSNYEKDGRMKVINSIKWAHLDIAGVAYHDSESFLSKQGATGYGVRLLIEFLNRYSVVR